MDYHKPVLAEESVEALAIKKDGIYVDATFGGGGHSSLILEQLGDNGRLFGFDQDEDALQNVPNDPRFTFVQHNFRYLSRFLRLHGVKRVDGILADLGVSSHQLDVEARGFSYRFSGPLDMRMNQEGELDAATVLNTYGAKELQQLFGQYGEVRNARSLARHIVQERDIQPLKSIDQFLLIIDPLIRGNRHRYLAQVFQALRIEVNDEVGALKEFLEQSLEVLEEGGRLAVISYHSLEDRFTKKILQTGNVEGTVKKDYYGNIYRPFKILTRKPVLPSEAEIIANPRARSARLRVGEKQTSENET